MGKATTGKILEFPVGIKPMSSIMEVIMVQLPHETLKIFSLIPSTVAKQPSLTSKGAFFAIPPFININI